MNIVCFGIDGREEEVYNTTGTISGISSVLQDRNSDERLIVVINKDGIPNNDQKVAPNEDIVFFAVPKHKPKSFSVFNRIKGKIKEIQDIPKSSPPCTDEIYSKSVTLCNDRSFRKPRDFGAMLEKLKELYNNESHCIAALLKNNFNLNSAITELCDSNGYIPVLPFNRMNGRIRPNPMFQFHPNDMPNPMPVEFLYNPVFN